MFLHSSIAKGNYAQGQAELWKKWPVNCNYLYTAEFAYLKESLLKYYLNRQNEICMLKLL